MWAKLMVFGNYGVITMTNHTIINAKHQTSEVSWIHIECVICEEPISEDQIDSTGPYNADGKLTFVCLRHKQNFRQLLNLFADFRAAERQRLTEKALVTSETAPDAWFLH
jgi:hypothetical protein